MHFKAAPRFASLAIAGGAVYDALDVDFRNSSSRTERTATEGQTRIRP
jgi:hypothetical protein